MNLHDWIDEVCDTLDLDDVEIDESLVGDVATVTAKRVHPLAGPATAYLLGLAAAEAGGRPAQVEDLAERVLRLAATWGDRVAEPGEASDDDPPADEGGADYAGDLDLGSGDDDDLMEVS